MASQMVVFDMDGVLVEVSESYRETIVQTVKFFTGHTITRDRIQEYKNQGGWNNDWLLSQRILRDLDTEVPYATIVDRFNKIFFGEDGVPGLILRERWIARPGVLESLASSYDMAVFTGRLRYEADVTLNRSAPGLRFDPIICADDVSEPKPAPEGLLKIAAQRPGTKLWYVGDTVDDARSARAAGVPFIGIAAPDHSRRTDVIALFRQESAVAILDDINTLEETLREL